MTRTRWLPNPHPGEILFQEFLQPMALSQTALARAISVPPRRINEIVLGKRAITADTDLRLARYFGMSDGFFIGLQTDYELMERKRAIGSVSSVADITTSLSLDAASRRRESARNISPCK